MKTFQVLVLASLWAAGGAATQAGQQGQIHDPEGHSNLRSGQSSDAAVIAKVPAGEVFDFEPGEGSEWWRVTLRSGKAGWMHYSRIMQHAEMADLKDGEAGDELMHYCQGRGINYYKLARGAAKGELEAMTAYFAITDTDGGAAEMHCGYFMDVVHLLGDEKWSAFLAGQPLDYRLAVRSEYVKAMEMSVFEPMGYLSRHFPKTAALLFRKEIVDWVSPDGKYAVRKVFSAAEPRENSRVERAELVSKENGDVTADLTPDDSGEGIDREGRVLWSPDSRRLAMFCVTGQAAQTVIYQASGAAKFARVNVPEPDLPGRAGDAELKGAKKIYSHVEPLKWESPQRMVLRRHEYWEGKHADGSINSIGRTYLVTVVVAGGNGRVEKVEVER